MRRSIPGAAAGYVMPEKPAGQQHHAFAGGRRQLQLWAITLSLATGQSTPPGKNPDCRGALASVAVVPEKLAADNGDEGIEAG